MLSYQCHYWMSIADVLRLLMAQIRSCSNLRYFMYLSTIKLTVRSFYCWEKLCIIYIIQVFVCQPILACWSSVIFLKIHPNQLEKLKAAKATWLVYLSLLSLVGPYLSLLGLTGQSGPYWALLGLTKNYWALLGLTGPYWVLPSLT